MQITFLTRKSALIYRRGGVYVRESPASLSIDDFRGACAFKGNGAVAGQVKRVDHDDVFDALLFREETLSRHYFKLKFDFS